MILSTNRLEEPTWGLIYLCSYMWRASLVAQTVQNLPAVPETWVRSLGWQIPWRRAWQPTPGFLPGRSPWMEELAGCSPWGCKEPGMTEVGQHSICTSPLGFLFQLPWGTELAGTEQRWQWCHWSASTPLPELCGTWERAGSQSSPFRLETETREEPRLPFRRQMCSKLDQVT